MTQNMASSPKQSCSSSAAEPVTHDRIQEDLCSARKFVSGILLQALRQQLLFISDSSLSAIASQQGASFKVVKHLLQNPGAASRQSGTAHLVTSPLDFVVSVLEHSMDLNFAFFVLQSQWHRFAHSSRCSRMNSRHLVRDLRKRGTFLFYAVMGTRASSL
jgi:hypothetical protein